MEVSGGVIQEARLAVNGVAPYPVRLTAVEAAVRGQAITEALAERAGQIAIRGVQPLAQNEFKVTLLKNLVKRAIRGTET